MSIPPEMLNQLHEVLQAAASGQQPLSQADLLLVSSLLWSLSGPLGEGPAPRKGGTQCSHTRVQISCVCVCVCVCVCACPTPRNGQGIKW